jgi:endonuclease YncB( thermonuclease family)
MCGRKHMEGTTAADCTRACVAHGSKFALVVGDKIYTLDTADKAVLDTLDKQAGKTATVTGTVDGDTIEVSSVAAK